MIERSANVLIVDDERNIGLMLEQMLALEGHTVEIVGDGESALSRLERSGIDAVLLDVRLPGIDGVEVLRRMRTAGHDVPVVMMSGHGTIETAVRAVREGAHHFLEKPLTRDITLVTLGNALASRELVRENERLRSALGQGELVGRSTAMDTLRDRIARAAPTDANVLIHGESGSGKELVARAVHRKSARNAKPFVAVNCAALPLELIESELFGHVPGAFTGATARRAGKFEAADGGTLFLDEIGDMPLEAQAKLLRVLETREVTRLGTNDTRKVDVRVVAATHRDLERRARDGSFREDLFHRLNVARLEVPPLRARREDVPVLAELFLERAVADQGLTPRRFAAEALQALGRHDWPGNVRELKNVVERIAIFSPTATIDADAVTAEFPRIEDAGDAEATRLKDILAAAERDAIHAAVRGANGNVAEAARRLGLERSHLYKRARAVGVSLRDA